MDENFLHYIWKFQKFTNNELRLTNNETLVVFDPGFHNQDSGPDFEEARIKIGAIEWVGQVEVHIHSSDWNRHGHSADKAYHNVVLHVVWNNDQDISINNEIIPTLEIKEVINPLLVKKYHQHIESKETIPCSALLPSQNELIFKSMLDRVLVERLENKANRIQKNLELLQSDWEAVTYQALASNFGFSVNKSAFITLCEHLPYEVIKKNTNEPLKLEALLFGQAGFLSNPKDQYMERLHHEFGFLSSKYQLPAPMELHHWKFGRMRPANFPTIRLAQFAALMHYRPKLFTSLISIENPKDIIKIISCELHTYWQEHYDFGKKRKRLQKKIGQSTFDNILINTVVPLLTAYSKHTDQQLFMNKAIEILEQIRPESNRVVKQWVELYKQADSAFDSQGLIELYTHYCHKRKCLQCAIGTNLLDR